MFLENINKIDKPLARLIKKKGRKSQINKIRNEKKRGYSTQCRNTKDHKRLFYANKMDNLEEMDKFLEKYNLLLYVCLCCHLSCVWLFSCMDGWPQGSSLHGILQARVWSGLPCPPPGDLPDPEIEPANFMPPALAGRFFITSAIWEAPFRLYIYTK